MTILEIKKIKYWSGFKLLKQKEYNIIIWAVPSACFFLDFIPLKVSGQ